jgi:hypothetical protein
MNWPLLGPDEEQLLHQKHLPQLLLVWTLRGRATAVTVGRLQDWVWVACQSCQWLLVGQHLMIRLKQQQAQLHCYLYLPQC